ncbi:hypothetical protein BDQ17DRAFT_1238847 [Cyathus striatus]|nr:hypothetical protein BDQ17DRAFT_1238847 [Cyathus striatus]
MDTNIQQPAPGPSAIPHEQTTKPAPDSLQAHIPANEDRSQLVLRARSFLQSPQIQHQDIEAKRRFLSDKGLNNSEIDGLLRELPLQLPYVPPRTYPQLPPSSLPNLLLGLARIFTWISGGSVILMFIYYRVLLPRINHTFLARNSLKSHHLSLMRKLTTSLSTLKESQAEAFSVLPRTEPYKEPSSFARCNSVSDILDEVGKEENFNGIPEISLLRCGISDFGKCKEENTTLPDTEDLFRYLEGCIPWLLTEEGLKYEQRLWETLTSCPLFEEISETTEQEKELPLKWTFTPPAPEPSSPIVQSLNALHLSLPKVPKGRSSPFQHVLQTLSDLTGYISTQVYLPYHPSTGAGIPSSGTLSPVVEELRREIRALKGLLLNRRSFMTSIPRPGGLISPRPTATT